LRYAPSVVIPTVKKKASSEGSYDVSDILVAGPQSEDEASALGRPPIAHDGSVHLIEKKKKKKCPQYVRLITVRIELNCFSSNNDDVMKSG
jgi:hypothetical protein